MSSPASGSALSDALQVVGDRWALLIIAALLDGPRRFGDLQGGLPGIASNVLAQRLRHLEAHGVVVSQPYSERPPRFVYELTSSGRGLSGAVRSLADWGAGQGDGSRLPRHAACGSEVEATWYCPTCERPVADEEIDALDYA